MVHPNLTRKGKVKDNGISYSETTWYIKSALYWSRDILD